MFEVTLQPAGLTFLADGQQDLLTAARAAGIAVPAACRNGVCEICAARLVAGQAVNTRTNQPCMPGSELMLCRALACSDLQLEITAVMAAGQTNPRKMQARVTGLEAISHDVYRVRLSLPRRRELVFHAGQYLAIQLPDTEPAYFSIASSPDQAELELHIQASPDWVSAQRVVDALRAQPEVTLELPYGKACLAAVPHQPLVLVAAGTGFAQMKSIIDFLRHANNAQPVHLYWGVRRLADMYLLDLAREWEQELAPLFTFSPLIGDNEDNDWAGHHDQLARAVLSDGHDWANVQVLASGSPVMVYTLMDALLAQGLPEAAFLSDVLEYAPR